MFDEKDMVLLEEFGISRKLYALINDIHKLVTDTKMKQAEYSPEQLKNDFGINYNGTITIAVEPGENDCYCETSGSGCKIMIGQEVIDKKSSYEKIAHELTHFMRDQQHQVHDNNGNWKAGKEAGMGSVEQVASWIVELYKRNELEAKVNEMYYKCINNPSFVCEMIKKAAEDSDGNVKLYYNTKRTDDPESLLNNLFRQLDNTIHLGHMVNYYNIVANSPDGNEKSPLPTLLKWSSQRNFPFKFSSSDPKKAKAELLDQMSSIYNEYLESLIKVAKDLIKEFVKAFFNKGQQNQEGQQQQNGQPQQQQNGQNEPSYGADSVSEGKINTGKKIILTEDKLMKAIVLKFVNKLEGYKTAVKNLHWDSKNMSQHKLFDDIADSLADFQDKVSEVEQSMSGRLPLNKLEGTRYDISSPQQMLKDLLSDVKTFYSGLQKLGDDYIGMRSDCEAYISDLQRQQYLLDFTLKESLKRRLKKALNERLNINQTINKPT